MPDRCPTSKLTGYPRRTRNLMVDARARKASNCRVGLLATRLYCDGDSPRSRTDPRPALGRPPRTQRESAVIAVRVELDRQNLVQLNDIGFEAQPRPCHVQPPHLRGRQPDLLDRLVPVLDEIAAPVAQRQRVVMAQVLLMHDFEADVLRLGDDAP